MDIASILISTITMYLAILALHKVRKSESRIDKTLKTMFEMVGHSEECFDEIHERLNQAGLKQAESRMKEVRKLRLAGKL